MTVKWSLFTLFQQELLTLTLQSIVGVTYMDHFDFEERYRDVNECDPFYWHPLHMPEYCAEMYEKLIRSRIAKNSPVRIFRNREKDKRGRRLEYGVETERYDHIYDFGVEPQESSLDYSDDQSHPIYEVSNAVSVKRAPLSPYEKMLYMVQKDVMKKPAAPSVQILPGLGPVAIYHQPVSGKTETMIKQIATAYGKMGQNVYADYAPYFSKPNPPPLGGGWVPMKKVNSTMEKLIRRIGSGKKKGNVIVKDLKNGGVITVIRSEHASSHEKKKT